MYSVITRLQAALQPSKDPNGLFVIVRYPRKTTIFKTVSISSKKPEQKAECEDLTALCQEEPGCTDINVPGGSASVCHSLRSSLHFTFYSAVGAGCRVVKFYCSDLEQSYEVLRTGQYPSIPVSENGVY